MESCSGRLDEKYLNKHIFVNMTDACQRVEAWRTDHNSVRPHQAEVKD